MDSFVVSAISLPTQSSTTSWDLQMSLELSALTPAQESKTPSSNATEPRRCQNPTVIALQDTLDMEQTHFLEDSASQTLISFQKRLIQPNTITLSDSLVSTIFRNGPQISMKVDVLSGTPFSPVSYAPSFTPSSSTGSPHWSFGYPSSLLVAPSLDWPTLCKTTTTSNTEPTPLKQEVDQLTLKKRLVNLFLSPLIASMLWPHSTSLPSAASGRLSKCLLLSSRLPPLSLSETWSSLSCHSFLPLLLCPGSCSP